MDILIELVFYRTGRIAALSLSLVSISSKVRILWWVVLVFLSSFRSSNHPGEWRFRYWRVRAREVDGLPILAVSMSLFQVANRFRIHQGCIAMPFQTAYSCVYYIPRCDVGPFGQQADFSPGNIVSIADSVVLCGECVSCFTDVQDIARSGAFPTWARLTRIHGRTFVSICLQSRYWLPDPLKLTSIKCTFFTLHCHHSPLKSPPISSLRLIDS